MILVNQAGRRFYDETAEGFTSNRAGIVHPYEQGSFRNLLNVKMDARSTAFLDAAMAGTGEPVNGGGPIWAIFDADAVKREKWNTQPPDVDIVNGFFFEGNTLAELASKVMMKYQPKPLPAATLEDTVARYNSFVDAGKDADFDKPKPKYKIQSATFYAAWATPVVHDTRAGVRINAKCQVVDMKGASDSRTVRWRRVCWRLQPAWPGAERLSGVHRRQGSGGGESLGCVPRR